jgi:hypothetical protein
MMIEFATPCKTIDKGGGKNEERTWKQTVLSTSTTTMREFTMHSPSGAN